MKLKNTFNANTVTAIEKMATSEAIMFVVLGWCSGSTKPGEVIPSHAPEEAWSVMA